MGRNTNRAEYSYLLPGKYGSQETHLAAVCATASHEVRGCPIQVNMGPGGLSMGTKQLKFIKISRSQAVQLELHPFLTESHADKFPRNWFQNEHMVEVLNLLEPVLANCDSFDQKSWKDKDVKRKLQDCLIGQSVRLGYTLRRKAEPHSIITKSTTRGGYKSARIQDVKLIVYVCPRQHASNINVNSAFSQLLADWQKTDQSDISKYFQKVPGKKPTTSTSQSTTTFTSTTTTNNNNSNGSTKSPTTAINATTNKTNTTSIITTTTTSSTTTGTASNTSSTASTTATDNTTTKTKTIIKVTKPTTETHHADSISSASVQCKKNQTVTGTKSSDHLQSEVESIKTSETLLAQLRTNGVTELAAYKCLVPDDRKASANGDPEVRADGDNVQVDSEECCAAKDFELDGCLEVCGASTTDGGVQRRRDSGKKAALSNIMKRRKQLSRKKKKHPTKPAESGPPDIECFRNQLSSSSSDAQPRLAVALVDIMEYPNAINRSTVDRSTLEALSSPRMAEIPTEESSQAEDFELPDIPRQPRLNGGRENTVRKTLTSSKRRKLAHDDVSHSQAEEIDLPTIFAPKAKQRNGSHRSTGSGSSGDEEQKKGPPSQSTVSLIAAEDEELPDLVRENAEQQQCRPGGKTSMGRKSNSSLSGRNISKLPFHSTKSSKKSEESCQLNRQKEKNGSVQPPTAPKASASLPKPRSFKLVDIDFGFSSSSSSPETPHKKNSSAAARFHGNVASSPPTKDSSGGKTDSYVSSSSSSEVSSFAASSLNVFQSAKASTNSKSNPHSSSAHRKDYEGGKPSHSKNCHKFGGSGSPNKSSKCERRKVGKHKTASSDGFDRQRDFNMHSQKDDSDDASLPDLAVAKRQEDGSSSAKSSPTGQKHPSPKSRTQSPRVQLKKTRHSSFEKEEQAAEKIVHCRDKILRKSSPKEKSRRSSAPSPSSPSSPSPVALSSSRHRGGVVTTRNSPTKICDKPASPSTSYQVPVSEDSSVKKTICHSHTSSAKSDAGPSSVIKAFCYNSDSVLSRNTEPPNCARSKPLGHKTFVDLQPRSHLRSRQLKTTNGESLSLALSKPAGSKTRSSSVDSQSRLRLQSRQLKITTNFDDTSREELPDLTMSKEDGSSDNHQKQTLDSLLQGEETQDCFTLEQTDVQSPQVSYSRRDSSPLFNRKRPLQHSPEESASSSNACRKRWRSGEWDRAPLMDLTENSRDDISLDSSSMTRPALSLCDEELQNRVLALKEELMAVFNGTQHSDRHKRYMEGGASRRLLDHDAHLQCVQEGQEDVVMDVLLTMFTGSQLKNLDYLMRVMLPEALMRIHQQVNGQS